MSIRVLMHSPFLICALTLLSACDLFTSNSDPWDANIPPSEDFDASRGVWNHDGSEIAFSHSESGQSNPGNYDQVWVLNLETGRRRQVSPGRKVALDWSPDGEWMLYHTPTTPEYLFKLNMTTGETVPLTGPGSPNPDLHNTQSNRWSPDGSSILFTIVAGEPRGLALMDPDGSNARIIIPYGVRGYWRPDGERIVYINWDTEVDPAPRRRQIFSANTDGSDVVKLTDFTSGRTLSSPAYSPDGSRIAFGFVPSGTTWSQVFTMNADGSKVRQMTSMNGEAIIPIWHPTDNRILFTEIIPNVSKRMYLLDTETLRVTPVFPAPR